MRLSLKDLLAVVAFVAVISWCASEVGSDIPFWVALFVSLVAAVVFVRAARLPAGRPVILLAPLIAFLPTCLIVISPAVFVNSGMLILAGVAILLMRPLKVRTLSALVMVIMAGSFTLAALESRRQVSELQAMREEFPVVSLAHRLTYERGHNPSSDSGVSARDLDAKPRRKLEEFEQSLEFGTRRTADLRMIHGREYERFVRSMGFGVMRMRRPNAEYVRMPPLRDIGFNEIYLGEPDPYGRWDFNFLDGESAADLHEFSRADFLNPDGFGYVPERMKASGFIAHAMHKSPVEATAGREFWTIERLELVSLLKFDEPRVYVLEHLPRMDQLSSDDVPTRPLDEFEQSALEMLWTEHDFVFRERGNEYRMLGSLRAAKQCLDCHSARRGELLGAFTYVVRRGEAGKASSFEDGAAEPEASQRQ